jgi:uncharacterized protein YjbI with pentapeptide repeats
MADEQHLALLNQGVDAWNKWREKNPALVPNLNRADLSGASLGEAYLHGANLHGADLRGADLSGANLRGAYLRGAYLREAYLREANLSGADFSWADLSNADLRGADLNRATLVKTNFSNANLDGCLIYGISAWAVDLEETIQSNLVITPHHEPRITVDNLEVAQFIYLLLNNERIRDVINTITSKAVLILGRFTPERKAVLNAIRKEIRRQNCTAPKKLDTK